MKKLLTLTIMGALAMAAPAIAEDTAVKSESTVKALPNGGMKTNEVNESTDANGTVTKTETTKKVDIDSKGNKETKVDIETTQDPKGLFNKSTTKVENKAVENDGKSEYSHKKTVDGKTVEESDDMKK